MTLQSIRQHLMILAVCLLLVPLGGCGSSTTTPSAPTGLTITSTVSQNTLSWNAVSGAVFYDIYRGTAKGAEVAFAGSFTTTFTDTTIPVSSNTPYYYVVTALDSNNNESTASNEVSVSPPVLSGSVTSPTAVALTWTLPASATGVTGYNIYRSTASGLESSVLASSASTSYTDTTVTHGTTYYYRVTSTGSAGESLGSNEVFLAP
jgi:fibronectin type 3 domain-containing protein